MKLLWKIFRTILVVIGALTLAFAALVFYQLRFENEPVYINMYPNREWLFSEYVDTLRASGPYLADTMKICMTSVNDSARARQIKDYFQLDTLYAVDADTWTKSLAIASFVSSNIPHANQKVWPDERNAIYLWEYTKNTEPAFNCRLHSIMMYDLLQAAGIEARYITCMPQDKEDDDCHVVNHIWLPELHKWAMLDSDMGGNWAADEDGTPLSLPEIREKYISGEPIYYHPKYGKATKKVNDYYSYIAKNTYWFSCWETLHFDQESSNKEDVGRYIHLVPKDFEPFGVDNGEIITSDAEQFWAAPDCHTSGEEKNCKELVPYAYCSYGSHHPFDYINEGNNLDIVLGLREPKSLDELNSNGIACTQKQLDALRRGGIVRKVEDGRWVTAISIFNYEQTLELRKFSKALSQDVYPLIKSDFQAFITELEGYGFRKNAYSLCFSYVLDDKCWNYLTSPTGIKTGGPWSGCIWFLNGKRPEPVPGTNSYGKAFQTWNYDLTTYADFNLLMKIAKGLSKDGELRLPEKWLNRSKSAGFVDNDGNLTIPVIDERKMASLCSLADKIGKTVADQLKAHINDCFVLSIVKNRSTSEIILCHELIWDIMECLLDDGLIQLPSALKEQSNSDAQDIREIVYIVI